MSTSSNNSSLQPSVEFGESSPAHETEQFDAKPAQVDLADEGEFVRPVFVDANDSDPALNKLADASLVQAALTDKHAEPHSSAVHLSCPKCGADRVAKSRVVGRDVWRVRLLPRRPYRCLRCYTRFWHKEPFMSDKRRVQFWALLIVALLVAVAWQLLKPANDGSSVAIGSAQNSSSFGDISSAATSSMATDALVNSAESQRQLVKNMSFLPPRRAQAETRELRNAGLSDTEIGLRLLTLKPPAPAVDGVKDVQEAKPIDNVGETSAINKAVDSIFEQATDEPPPAASANDTKGEGQQSPAVTQEAVNTQGLSQLEEKQLSLAVLKTIENWRRSWSLGDGERYLEFYVSDFKPQSGVSNQVWREQRLARISPSRGISVGVTNAKVVFDRSGQAATVSFDQSYSSNSYKESSRKELRLNKKLNQWYIELEREL